MEDSITVYSDDEYYDTENPEVKKKLKASSEDSMVELNVLSIKQKRFSGNTSSIDPNETIQGLSNDPLELEILVEPF